jgi:hypothetical protein
MARLMLVFACVLACQLSLMAQNTSSKKALSYYDEAKTLYVKGEPQKALALLDKAIEKDGRFTDAFLLKADIYHTIQEFGNQKNMIKSAIGIDSLCYLPAYMSLGKACFNLGEYDESIAWFRKYEQFSKGKKGAMKVDDWVFKAEFARESVKNPFKFEPKNLGNNVNSQFDEYWPSLTADEQTIVFTVLVPRDTNLFKMGNLPHTSNYFQEDFFESKKHANGQWLPRERILPPLNSDGNEGAQTLSADGNWMFFTACGRPDSKGSCDIYFSQRTATGWTAPVNVGNQVNSPFWESQPTFSADGKTLFFISNRTGGHGGKDVWMAQVVGKNAKGAPIFGQAKNLGGNINTSGDENSPFVHPDTKTLFFSSDGWPGMGRMDVFLSRLDKFGKWGKAINLGFPINTANDEVGFVVNARGDKAYYSSDGIKDGAGGKDLYVFELPAALRPASVSYVKGRVFDVETKLPVGASFELLRLPDGNLEVQSQAGVHDGQFLLCLPPNQNYALNVSHPGYLFYSGNVDVTGVHNVDEPRLLEIGLIPIKVGGSVVLNNVFFDTNSSALKDDSKVELDKVADFLTLNANVKVELQGHTDNVGSAASNLELSAQRAKAVAGYLIDKGIAASRLSPKGYGFTKPVADNATDEGRAQNRRTEMVVVGK